MEPIPCYRSAHLMPYLSFWKELGVPFEKYLREKKLPTQIFGETELYLPLLPTITCIRTIQNVQGIDDMAYRVLQSFHFTNLDEQLVSAALQSPTLLSALTKFSEYVGTENPAVRFWIVYGETNVRLCISDSLPLEPLSSRYQEWAELRVLTTFIQAFLGSGWLPQEMAFRSMIPLSQFISEQYPDTRFLVGQDAN